MHYRISYNLNKYYHVFVSDDINDGSALDIVNSDRCLKYDCQDDDVVAHENGYQHLSEHNGIASIFMKSDDAPNLDPHNPHVTHVYVNNGNGEIAKDELVNRLNELNNNHLPRIVLL